ncbi:MAG: acyl carrier protein [Clostridiales bacterium]|nr:acyl carrier protein [Clostridiales bacterium]
MGNMDAGNAHLGSENQSKLDKLFLDMFRAEGVNDEDSPATIAGWDSLTHLRLAEALEGVFDVAVDVEDLSAMRSVAKIKEFLRGKGVSL